MFFGALAGGAGAKLGGGNFWQGAVTGLFVAGMNHLAHRADNAYEDNKLDKAITNAKYGLDDDISNWTNNDVKTFASRVFKTLYESSNCPDFQIQKIIKNDPRIMGKTLGIATTTNSVIKVVFTGVILIKQMALYTIHRLASTVGHELNYATDMVSGDYSL